MKKVDETIEAICDCIQTQIQDEKKMSQTKPEELICALAKLIEARAHK